MEVSALKYSGGIGLHGRPALLRLQSDERLIAYLRKGNTAAFEVLFARYEARLMAFCRHLLGSREDAEDVLQEVMTAAFNAIIADERAINVRPWLYRIARNRSLNHLRRARSIASDTMDSHFSDHGASTADKVHDREEFRLLVGDIHELPETQKTALVLREMDALSYDQIAEAMETTVPSVKSLLVRARVSLAEAAEARLLSCDEVRIELGEMAEGLRRRPTPLVRRHLRSCDRCTVFRSQLRHTNKALAALMPIGPLVVLKNLAIFHLGHSAGSGATAASHTAAAGAAGAAGASSAGAAGAGLAAGGTALAGSGVAASGGFLSAGLGALAGKAAAGFAAAAIVTAGAVEADHGASARHHHHPTAIAAVTPATPAQQATVTPIASGSEPRSTEAVRVRHRAPVTTNTAKAKIKAEPAAGTGKPAPAKAAPQPTKAKVSTPVDPKAKPGGRSQTTTDPTVLTPPAAGSRAPAPTPASPPPTQSGPAPSTAPTSSSPPPSSTTTTSTTPTSTTTTTTPTSTTTAGTAPAPTSTTSTTSTTPTPAASSAGHTDAPAPLLSISPGGPGF